jgi:uncharacterized repeat protein (TIGR02543 family)
MEILQGSDGKLYLEAVRPLIPDDWGYGLVLRGEFNDYQWDIKDGDSYGEIDDGTVAQPPNIIRQPIGQHAVNLTKFDLLMDEYIVNGVPSYAKAMDSEDLALSFYSWSLGTERCPNAPLCNPAEASDPTHWSHCCSGMNNDPYFSTWGSTWETVDQRLTRAYLIYSLAPLYRLTVNGSHALNSGAGDFVAGTEVTIRAGIRNGWEFDGWTVNEGVIKLGDAKSATTTFTMPDEDVTVTANWKEATPFTVTVNGSHAAVSGAGNYVVNATVTIDAGSRDDGYSFVNWTVVSGGVTLAASNSAVTTFTMPANNVTVTANWQMAVQEFELPVTAAYAEGVAQITWATENLDDDNDDPGETLNQYRVPGLTMDIINASDGYIYFESVRPLVPTNWGYGLVFRGAFNDYDWDILDADGYHPKGIDVVDLRQFSLPMYRYTVNGALKFDDALESEDLAISFYSWSLGATGEWGSTTETIDQRITRAYLKVGGDNGDGGDGGDNGNGGDNNDGDDSPSPYVPREGDTPFVRVERESTRPPTIRQQIASGEEAVFVTLSERNNRASIRTGDLKIILDAEADLLISTTNAKAAITLSSEAMRDAGIGGRALQIEIVEKDTDAFESHFDDALLLIAYGFTVIHGSQKIIEFDTPVTITICVADYDLTPEQLENLMGVRINEDGTVTEIEGEYCPETQTFSFLADMIDIYGVIVSEMRPTQAPSEDGGAAPSRDASADTAPTGPGNTLVLNEESPANEQGVSPFIMRSVNDDYQIGLISLRVFADFIGAAPVWDAATSTATVSGFDANGNPVVISLVSGETTITVNGQVFDIAEFAGAEDLIGLCTVYIEDGAIYLPLRAVTNAFGVSLGWDAETATVAIEK